MAAGRPVLSEADLRLTAHCIRAQLHVLEHNARHKGTQLRPGRVAQLERLELLYLGLADAKRGGGGDGAGSRPA